MVLCSTTDRTASSETFNISTAASIEQLGGAVKYGNASGPAWLSLLQAYRNASKVELDGARKQSMVINGSGHKTKVRMEFKTEVIEVRDYAHNRSNASISDGTSGTRAKSVVVLKNGKNYDDVDVIICATGVEPAVDWLPDCFVR